ncbi:VOC family protein [Burkholderia stagnalis]|uniref:VOC family protein n=1 Tax=Burkholderia stagnalis TaxID=1503054 RepID=UPI0007563FE6|nr:VOC family protein [Burkholderia stagnalis]KVO49605.1 lactoylglutathione lyase [Burkholderia stagnalis]KVP13628.1 lactoylglutathione lyase [Burkholderia stagnalis]KVW91132.1 lactoylglutathione lyase [Burkholderia stagnalis]KWH76319.1 lactoylglutathione lyase [Burkholderia stagnalis]
MKPILRGIDHIVLRVTDMAAMTRFYCDAVGCHVEKEQPDLGLVQLRAGASLIDLLAVGAKIDRPDNGPPGAGRNLDHLCLRVEPFDPQALAAHFAAHGARPGAVQERYGADGYGPSIYLFDPEGNMLELKGPPAAIA